jgi:hypothetical protein
MHPSRNLASVAAATAALALVPLTAHAATQPQVAGCSTGTITAAATIPNVLQGAETASFPVSVTPQGGGTSSNVSIAFSAGQTSRSTDVSGLAFGTYTVHQTAPAGWQAQPDQTLGVSAGQCTATATFTDAITAASATFQVATDPAGNEPGWNVTLVGPGTPVGGEKLTSAGTAPLLFATPLAEGFYTVAQTTRNGWDQTAGSGCAFTVDYPADAGRTFACSVTDVEEGAVTVAATHAGQPPSGGDAFHFVLSGGPDSVLLTQVAMASNGGALDFGGLRPGNYTLCQQQPPSGWSTTLVAQGGIVAASGDVCLPFVLGAGQARAFTVDTTGPSTASSPTPTPSPSSGVQGVSNGGANSTGSGSTHTTTTGGAGAGAIGIPNTGAGLSGLLGTPLLLLGGGLIVAGRRRDRRTPR